jgi:hypothetical protein
VEVDEETTDVSFERLREDLPESVPRFLCLSYPWKLDNDRVSYPLVFVYYAPEASAKLNMLYASTKSRLSRALELNKASKNFLFVCFLTLLARSLTCTRATS